MPKTTKNSGQPWERADITQLRQLAKENTPTRVIGLKLGRTPSAISQKAHTEGISLKPANQAPYTRTKLR